MYAEAFTPAFTVMPPIWFAELLNNCNSPGLLIKFALPDKVAPAARAGPAKLSV